MNPERAAIVPALDPLDECEDGRAAGSCVDGRYELIEPLGAGGMGTVWRARDLIAGADVALKLVHADRLEAVGVERLIREAKATASIRDAAVVRVQGFGICDGDGYIAMELLSGRTLESVLDDAILCEADAVRVMLPIVGALSAAHAAGVVHRDVKPANIMLVAGPDGTVQPKLLDFGIARELRSTHNRLTCTGQVLGTPYYMAYEQAGGRTDIDHRADVWAVCSVLYELIAGIGPFDGDNYNAVVRAVLMDPPVPLDEVMPDADRELWTLIERGLAKDREARWPSVDDLGLELRRWLVKRGYRTDVTGRLLVTSDFPVRPRSLRDGEFARSDESEYATPAAQLAAAPHLAPDRARASSGTDDSGAMAPQGFARTIVAPTSHRIGYALAVCTLMAAPLFALGAQDTAAELAPSFPTVTARYDDVAAEPPPGPVEASPGPVEAAETPLGASETPHDRAADEASERSARVDDAHLDAVRVKDPAPGTPEAATSDTRRGRPNSAPVRPKRQAIRYAPGSSLPLPAAPRFR